MSLRQFAAAARRGTFMSAPRMEGEPSPAEIKKLIENVSATFEAFKAANDARLKEIENKKPDVVTDEKVTKINNAVTELQTAIDDVNRKMAAAAIGGGSGGARLTPEQKAHRVGFLGYMRTGAEAGLRDLEVKASATLGSDPSGGYFAPVETTNEVDRVLQLVSAIRGIAQVQQISGRAYRKPVSQGGATANWVGETQTRAETNTPTVSVLEFVPGELSALPYATQDLLDDSAVNIEEWLAGEVALTFADKEGLAFWSGDGVNKPRGISTYSIVADASYAWGSLGYTATGAAATFATANPADAMITLQGTLKTGYQNNASWLMNRNTATAVRKFKDGQGNYMWQPSMQAGQPATIFGKPTVTDDNVDDLGANKYPIVYGDFRRGYLIVDRIGIRVLRDPLTNKPFVGFYTTKRVGGGVQNFEALKLLKCAVS